jgi:hypothetical protein
MSLKLRHWGEGGAEIRCGAMNGTSKLRANVCAIVQDSCLLVDITCKLKTSFVRQEYSVVHLGNMYVPEPLESGNGTCAKLHSAWSQGVINVCVSPLVERQGLCHTFSSTAATRRHTKVSGWSLEMCRLCTGCFTKCLTFQNSVFPEGHLQIL